MFTLRLPVVSRVRIGMTRDYLDFKTGVAFVPVKLTPKPEQVPVKVLGLSKIVFNLATEDTFHPGSVLPSKIVITSYGA